MFALAALALLLQVLVPPGFMLSGEPAAPGLVICTGHGPLLGHADHDKAPKPSNTPCAFAVHGGTAAPPAPATVVALTPAAFAARVELPVPDIAPGRGLAAPPPPSQAPPIALV